MAEVKHDDSKFKFYAGLTFYQFFILLQFLGPAARKLTGWNSDVKYPETSPNMKRGCKRKLSPQYEFCFTLVRLQLALLHSDLAQRFEISTGTVSTIVLTWAQFLYTHFGRLRNDMFPSRLSINKSSRRKDVLRICLVRSLRLPLTNICQSVLGDLRTSG